jgi:hypothetical protein
MHSGKAPCPEKYIKHRRLEQPSQAELFNDIQTGKCYFSPPITQEQINLGKLLREKRIFLKNVHSTRHHVLSLSVSPFPAHDIMLLPENLSRLG